MVDDIVVLQFTDQADNVLGEINAEIADTHEKRRMGLSKRAFMPSNAGMFFDKVGAYWMKDVNFPLDIVFLDKKGTVLEKQHMDVTEEPDHTKKLYIPSFKTAAHAVELPDGWFDRHGISVGDKVKVAGH